MASRFAKMLHNIHPSALPSGAAAPRAILLAFSDSFSESLHSAITLMIMNEALDEGAIITNYLSMSSKIEHKMTIMISLRLDGSN
jgi:methionyl-tRNA formyltransferase